MIGKWTGIICLLAMVAVETNAASLDPFFAQAGVRFGPVDPVSASTSTSSAVARIDPLTGLRGESGFSSAAANLQGLSVAAGSAVVTGSANQPARPFTAYSTARVQSFDLMLTDETGSGQTHTDVSLSFALDGFISIAGLDTGNSFLGTALNINYGLGAAGPNSSAQPRSIGLLAFYDAFQTPQDNPSASASGFFDGIEYKSSDLIDQIFTTPTFSVPLDSYITFQLELRASAGGTSNSGDQISTVVDFGNTLTFMPDAFFNLATGVTANSASLGLVDNAIDAPAPVPLPAAGYLFITALAGLFARKRLARK